MINGVYPSRTSYWVNTVLLPLRMIIPQPLVHKIPGLLTNEDVRFRYVLQHVKGKLLDIGCGANRLVKQYRETGGDGTGVDVFHWNESVMPVKDTSDLPFGPGAFDTVTFVASINHIPNRGEVLKEAHRLLSDDGRLIVTNLTPFIAKIWHKWAFWDKDQHVRGMKEGELFGLRENHVLHLLDQAGFRVIEKERFSWKINCLYLCRKK